MKFLNKNNNIFFKKSDKEDNLFYLLLESNLFFDYEKIKKKNRKKLSSIKPGITTNKNKNSIKRDFNLTVIQQYLNLSQKKGNKLKIFKHLNFAVENLFNVLNFELNDFKKYDFYKIIVYLYNSNFFFCDFNKIVENLLIEFKSVFEIKTKKNNKKQNLNKKYSHEISYIPEERRLKYVLKNLNIFKDTFKNYNIWERLFWSFLLSIIEKKNSFLKKRREYIYLKSIKFFKKKTKIF